METNPNPAGLSKQERPANSAAADKGAAVSGGGLALALLLFTAYAFIHQARFNGPTAVSRLNLLHALVSHGTVQIDAYHENTPDKAKFDGHYYSDKAPGTVALALPGLLVAATAQRGETGEEIA